jgi:hypothetical protein
MRVTDPLASSDLRLRFLAEQLPKALADAGYNSASIDFHRAERH